MANKDIGLLQANLNHCAAAQDLFRHALAQWQIDVAVVAEPYFVLDKPNWHGDMDGSVVIVGGNWGGGTLPLEPSTRGRGFVTTRHGETVVVGTHRQDGALPS